MNDIRPPHRQVTHTPTPASHEPPVVLPPTPGTPHSKKTRNRETLKNIISTLLILIIAPLLALTITAFMFQSYEVDGQSMETSLQNGDRLIIWKTPRTWARITKHDYIPNRGDVIVFVKKGMYDFNSDKEKQLIKRVIGLPGDRVVVKDGTVTVFNTEYPEGFQPDTTLPYGDEHPIGLSEGNVDITVGPGEIFVCGDNRGNSLDSRYFGTIPANDIVGKLIARILPLGNAKKF